MPDIERRVEVLERHCASISRIIASLVQRFSGPKKVNAKSRELSSDESRRFNREMAEHRVESRHGSIEFIKPQPDDDDDDDDESDSGKSRKKSAKK